MKNGLGYCGSFRNWLVHWPHLKVRLRCELGLPAYVWLRNRLVYRLGGLKTGNADMVILVIIAQRTANGRL